MAYISSVAEKTYTIDIGENSPQREIRIDERRFDIDWRQIAALAAGPPHPVNKPDVTGYRYEVLVAGHRFEIAVEDEREKALTGSIHSAHESGEAMVRAPMPGLVLGLPMEPGANVERGQTVVILEAMKMENDLASPITGKVKEIRVNKGQTVNQGDVLIVVSAE